MKSFKVQQETIFAASRRYVTPVFVPPFSFNLPTPGLETPPWSPPFNVVLTNAVMFGAKFEDPTGSSVVKVRKKNELIPYDDPVDILTLTLNATSFRVSQDLAGSYTSDLLLTPYDNVYCYEYSGESHAQLTVQLYAYRDDGV